MRPDLSISRTRLAFVLGALAMFGPFSIDTFFPAFGAMAKDFGVGQMAMQQTISVYLIAYAAASLFHGALSDAYGRRRIILSGLTVFALASVGCALSRTLETLLAWRALQGLSAGVGLIVGRAVIRDCLHGHDAQKMMSSVSMIFSIAPAIAPMVGGFILGWGGWHDTFWFLVLFAVALWLATFFALPETHPPAARIAFHPDTLLASFRTMLGNRAFVKLALAGSMNFNALFLYISSVPVFVPGLLGLDEHQYSWFFAPTIAGMMLGAFASGRMAGRVDGLRMANWGWAIGGVAGAINIAFNLLASDLHPLPFTAFGVHLLLPLAVLPVSLTAFGIALVFPILTLALLDMYPQQRGGASSAQAFIGLILNAIVAGVIAPFVAPAHGSHLGLRLATTAAGFTFIGWLLWRGHARAGTPAPVDAVDAAPLEPLGEL
ncbi:MAG: multidrug effflux MFS transporter [Proteobacteria bacterium]|nr:multidrug effflux MFS transporter [Pseudomonadota bacterium]